MNQQQTTQLNDEISLREIIEILLNYKFLIAAVTILATILAGIGTVTFMDETYESSIILTVADFQVEQLATGEITDLVELQQYSPNINVTSYLEQVKTPEVLKMVIEELQLTNETGDFITTASLSNDISVENPKDTNILRIMVSRQSAEEAAAIADAIGEKFKQYISENNSAQSLNAAGMIEKQLLLEEANLEEKSKAVANYLANNVSISELRNQVNNYESLINQYNNDMISLETDITIHKAQLEVLTASEVDADALADFDFDMSLSGDFSIDDIDYELLNENAIQSVLLTVKITDMQTQLLDELTTYEVYSNELESFKASLIEARNSLAEEEYRYNALNRDLSLANQTYSAYQQQHKEAVILAASNLGSAGINIASSAVIPAGPSSPNLMLNLAIGIVLGFMIGVFIAFFRAYWVRTSTKK